MNIRAKSGFTLAEILISIAIIVIIMAAGLYAFVSARHKASITTTGDDIAAALEAAKTNAITGNGGTAFGVKFNAGSYVTFTGTSYSSSDPSDVTHNVPGDITLSNTFPGPDYAVIFAHLSGTPNVTGTITVAGSASSTLVTVGTLGDISVIR